MKFSIVLPSRERVGLLGEMLDSFKANTDDLSQIEILIVHDDDDRDTAGFLDQVPYPFFKKFAVKRSLNFSRDYYNFLAARASGEWIICGNDDMRCQTPHWDTIAYDILRDKPRVIYGYIEDGLGGAKARGGGDYCCFPLQGMAGVKAMGFVFPARIPVWGADMWARNIYDKINSTVKLPITFFHYSHHNRTRKQDAISHRIAQNQVAYSVQPQREEVETLINGLNGVIPERVPEPSRRPANVYQPPTNRPYIPRATAPIVQPKPWTKKKMWVGA